MPDPRAPSSSAIAVGLFKTVPPLPELLLVKFSEIALDQLDVSSACSLIHINDPVGRLLAHERSRVVRDREAPEPALSLVSTSFPAFPSAPRPAQVKVKVVMALVSEVVPLATILWVPVAPALFEFGMWPSQVKVPSDATVAVQMLRLARWGPSKPVL